MAELTNLESKLGGFEFLTWGLPIQKRHLKDVRASSLQLASDEDPNETS